MKKRSRILCAAMAAVMVLGSLSGCSGSGQQQTNETTKAEASENSQAAAGGESTGAVIAEPVPQDPERKIKDTMTIAMIEEPTAISPGFSTISANSHVGRQIHDTLVKRDEATDEILPCLATEWEKKDDLTYVFHIRDDVYFHNGDKLTADDIVYNFVRNATMPSTKSRWSSIDVENTKALDDTTVEVKLTSPWGKFLLYVSGVQIVSKKLGEDPNSNIERNPVGTGPYKFVSWTTGDSVVLERNEDYWGEKAVTKQLVFKFFPDSSIRAIQLEAGDIDFFFQVGSEDYDRLMENPDIVVQAEVGTTHESMYFCQSNDSVYQDVRIRQALTYALDMPSIVEAVWGPMAVVADSIYPSTIEGHVSIGPAVQDIEKAKALVAEAGYPNGLDCELTVPNNSATLAYMEICQAMWAEAGINMTINSYDSATVKQMNASGQNPMGRSNFTGNGDPVGSLAAWEIGYSGVMQPQDEYIDERIKLTRAESDIEKRAQYLSEIQHYALEEKYYAIPVAFIKQSYAMSSDVFGFVFSPTENVFFSQVGVYE